MARPYGLEAWVCRTASGLSRVSVTNKRQRHSMLSLERLTKPLSSLDCPQLQVQVKQGMAMADCYAMRENPQRYPFISRETRRCVDKASYGHRDICLLFPALEKEGHRNLK